jgi:hypothetical protein
MRVSDAQAGTRADSLVEFEDKATLGGGPGTDDLDENNMTYATPPTIENFEP